MRYFTCLLCIKQRLLDAVQMVTAEIPIPPNNTGPVILPQNSFAVSVQEVDPEEFDMQIFSASLGNNPFSNPNLELNEDNLVFSPVTSSTASLTLPQNLLDSSRVSNFTRIAQSVFLTDALYLRRNKSLLEVGSVVLSASVINQTIDQLDPPISLRFLKNPVSIYTQSKHFFTVICLNHISSLCRGLRMLLTYFAHFGILS